MKISTSSYGWLFFKLMKQNSTSISEGLKPMQVSNQYLYSPTSFFLSAHSVSFLESEIVSGCFTNLPRTVLFRKAIPRIPRGWFLLKTCWPYQLKALYFVWIFEQISLCILEFLVKLNYKKKWYHIFRSRKPVCTFFSGSFLIWVDIRSIWALIHENNEASRKSDWRVDPKSNKLCLLSM